jgi:hypothetical protein
LAPTPAFGQAVTFTATVSGTGGLTPTGSVVFFDGANPIGTGTLSNGVATFATATLAAGPHSTITASYSGDGAFAGSTSSPVPETVLALTTTGVTLSSQTVHVGGSATFTAVVASGYPGTPSGTVTFYSSGQLAGTGTYQGNGTWTLATPAGFFPTANQSYAITARYYAYGIFAESWSSPVTEAVIPLEPTTTTLSLSTPYVIVGQSATFTAVVTSPTAGTLGDYVAFYSSGAFAGYGQKQGNVWTLATPAGFFPTAGASYSITARYYAYGIFAGSWASPVTEYVVGAPTATSLTLPSQTIRAGGSETFTAVVASSYPGTPTGTMTFYSSGQLAGTGTYQGNGTWTLATPAGFFPTAGASYSITANYSGDGSFAASGSNPVPVYVVPSTSSATTLTLSSPVVVVGGAVTFTATVNTSNGGTPTGSVAFYSNGAFAGYGQKQGNVWTLTTPPGFFPTYGVNYPITAYYYGDAAYSGSWSNAVTEYVVVALTTTSLTATSQTVLAGGSATFTAQVSAINYSSTPTGTVTFYCNGVSFGTGAYQGSGFWKITTTSASLFPTAGASYAITAYYSGGGTFGDSLSNAVTEYVVAPASTTQPSVTDPVVSSAGLSALYQNQPVTFSVAVSDGSGAGITTGNVEFYDGTTPLGAGVYQWTADFHGPP